MFNLDDKLHVLGHLIVIKIKSDSKTLHLRFLGISISLTSIDVRGKSGGIKDYIL